MTLLFLGLCFPLLNLGCICLRYTFLITAAHEAAYQGGISRTFLTAPSATDPSAIAAATNAVTRIIGKFSGVTVSSVVTRIVVCNMAGTVLERRTTKLSTPADTTQNVYFVETAITARVAPFIGMKKFYVNVPGITSPMDVVVCARKLSENPQGLNQ